MIPATLAFLQAAERGWAWLYTAGMRPDVADRRREELAADMSDHLSWAREQEHSGRRTMLDAGTQFLLGIPSDVTWRFMSGSSAVAGARVSELWMALGLVLVGFLGLPMGAYLALAGGGVLGHGAVTTLDQLRMIYVIVVTIVAGGSSALLFDRHATAAATLAVLAAVCITAAAWFVLPLVFTALVAAAFACVVATRQKSEA